jgi:ribose transport system substrate-binding protein
MRKFAAAVGLAAGFGLGLPVYLPVLAQTSPSIPIIVKDTTSPYWQAVLNGARKAGQELGVEVLQLGAQSQSDLPAQLGIVQNAIAKKPAALVIAAGRSSAIDKSLGDAKGMVKIVGIDTPEGLVASALTLDNAKAGRMAADSLAGAITRTYGDTEGDVAVVATAHGASLDQSAVGFRSQAKDKYRALNVVPDKVVESQAAAGLDATRALIAANRDLRGIFVSDPVLAHGVLQAVAENKSGDKINLVVLGADKDLVKGVLDGTIAALLVQDPVRIGYDAIKTARAAAIGDKVPANIDVDATLITKANINTPQSQELLGYVGK